MRDAHWQLHRINRIAILAEGDLVSDADELKTVIDERLDALKTVETRLRELRSRFFGELKHVGDTVGIPLPEPHEIELLEPGRSNLLERLVALREQEGRDEPDMRLALSSLREKGEAIHCPLLIRRLANKSRDALTMLCHPGEAGHRLALLRRPASPINHALKLLQA